MGGYLFRDRLDGVVKANTVLIHHPQSFLEGFLKATTNSHHLPCRGKGSSTEHDIHNKHLTYWLLCPHW